MKRSRGRILTTHVGSLVRPPEMVEILRRKADGAPFSAGEQAILARHIAEGVRMQEQCGVDVPSDGEYSKSGFAQYITDRLTGFEVRNDLPGRGGGTTRSRDRKRFADAYREIEGGSQGGTTSMANSMCTGPITYRGAPAVQTALANFKAEHRILTAAGTVRWVSLSTSLVRSADGEPVHRVVQLQDISERKRYEGQLQYLADHDALTGLFNRRRFEAELERELESSRRYETGGALVLAGLHRDSGAEQGNDLEDLASSRAVGVLVIEKQGVVSIARPGQITHAFAKRPVEDAFPIVALLGRQAIALEELVIDHSL